tara:strand:- start:569 stop:1582 length:1014 start_codon:yes stop_codon:yes gene_type:complete
MIDVPLIIVLSFLICMIVFPKAISKLNSKSITVPDIYKENKPNIPNQGAIITLFVSFLICGSYPLINRLLSRIFTELDFHDFTNIDLSILLLVSIFALYGILDDMFHFTWTVKLVLPIFFAFPLLPYLDTIVIDLPFVGPLDLEEYYILDIKLIYLFKLLVIPVYIMVVSNLVNMHSGFNGLQSGLSLILLLTILYKLMIDGNYESVLVSSSFLGGLFAFWFFNKYPSKIIEGNIGSQTTGALIGSLLVINNLYIFGIMILLIHIIDFLLFAYEKLVIKADFRKFGSIDSDGFINPPTPFKMKFLLPYFFQMREQTVVHSCYFLTIICCIISLMLFS